MNFFEQQEKARKRTATLIGYFILAVICIIVAVDLLILGTITYNSYPNSDSIHFTINGEQTTLVRNGHFDVRVLTTLGIIIGIVITPIILIIIGIGTLVRMIQIRDGGVGVAKMVDARAIDSNTSDFKEKRFINVVEEMSIASGVSVPQLFIMDNEKAINAFVAGSHPQDVVMVVTKGTLDSLNRDQLQGVIGHEFSHIYNGDMRISLRLIGLLGGIFAIGQLGAFILRSLNYRSSSSSSSSKDSGKGAIAVFIFGLGLFIIGYIGLFFGRLIKAAVSRQRESLADSCSVQYTRNPEGLVGALMAIKQNEEVTILQTRHAEDINHMCFCPSLHMWFSNLLASHPPLAQRINDLDPQGIYASNIKLAPQNKVSEEESSKENVATMPFALASAFTNVAAIENSIGNPNVEHIEYAQRLLANIPDNLIVQCHDDKQVDQILLAVILATAGDKQNESKMVLKKLIDENTFEQVLNNTMKIQVLDVAVLLTLVDLALPTFKLKSASEQMIIIARLEKLAALNQTLFSISIVAMIKNASLPIDKIKKARYNQFSPLLPEVSKLISFVIYCGQPNSENAATLYSQSMQLFTDKIMPMPSPQAIDPVLFQNLLAKLNRLTPLCKEKLLHACLNCVEKDNKITLNEAEVIRAIAACLNCPIPPILPTTG